MLERVSISLCLDILGLKLYVLKGYFKRGIITRFDINK